MMEMLAIEFRKLFKSMCISNKKVEREKEKSRIQFVEKPCTENQDHARLEATMAGVVLFPEDWRDCIRLGHCESH